MTCQKGFLFALGLIFFSSSAYAATLPVECGSGSFNRQVNVATAAELKSALSSAKAGDLIKLADGAYKGNFVATVSGSSGAKITLCGSRKAILDGSSLTSGYTLHLKGTSYYQLVGFSVTRGKNAIILDKASFNLIQNLAIYNVGNEALHLRTHSSNNIVTGNDVSGAGKTTASYGEGIYVGSAKSNWCTYTDCNPDKSDNNQVLNNKISACAAENIDIKEGTTNTLIQGNHFDGSGIKGENAADSWIDIKGNNVTIKNNIGVNSGKILLDGYQTHVVVDGWGEHIVFSGNKSTVNGKGYAIGVNKSKDVTVYCDNEAIGAGSGLANISCKQNPAPTPTPTPTPTPSPGLNSNIANAQAVISSSGMRSDQPVEKLFDACSKNLESCMAGSDVASEMMVELDFKSLQNIGSIKLFGDAEGNWVSQSFDIETKQNPSDSYQMYAKGISALSSAWITQTTSGLKARFLKVRVYGASGKGSVQARELEVWGRPATAGETPPVATPAPSVTPKPSATPVATPVASPTPSGSDLAVITLKASSSTYPGGAVSDVKVKYFGDQAYDSFALTKMDIFTIDPSQKQKTPLVIYIHGGGFRSGDKADSHSDAKNYLAKGIAYATINYRLLGTAPVAGQTVLMPLNDSRRALQFIRHYASQLNIDSEKIVLVGSSAGASTALWIGLQNDMEQPTSKDPVLRQSTRVSAIAVTSTQSTLDTYRWGTDPEFQGLYGASTANGKTLLKYSDVFYANTGAAFNNINQLLAEPWVSLRAKLDAINFMDSGDPEMYMENSAASSDTLHSYYQVDRLYAAAIQKGAKGVFKTPVETKSLPSTQKADSSLINFVLRKIGP